MDVGRIAELSTQPGHPLERLYRVDGARLWRALFAFSGDREIASDAVAEAFAQALGRGDAIRQPDKWVWRAAFRIAAGELKSRRRLGPTRPDGSYEMEEPPGDLIQALAILSPKQRAAAILYYYLGYPTREIADILDSSQAAVRVHLSQARKRLRRVLETDDD
jgi:RNA polymerase sigma-70 factor (ECF subfamily)